MQHTLKYLMETLQDYEIYFIKYNLTKNKEEISFFEELLENYKDCLYDLLNYWSNTTLSEIEKVYFNEQNKRTRTNIENTWPEISKKYQRIENNIIKEKDNKNSIPTPAEKTKKLSVTHDIKIEQKLLKDLINNVKKEFPYLKTN
ncbi:hypothetical protein LY90DRAFT_697455 [Neocallimastix californiae]|uniref:Uncharacterized protein n=1 Tax=Neocallimastix californiae TaxID=1754190 RepID=A0A1Y2FGT7_9FUNG|nr:hypothetical protein LY90DRAFT_697455 [Neocallimastix californiae]|eukprot:ORY82827.1 hypothetical protein LY90DRAFT_697455 [Neocallimastix californiae]